MKSQNQKLKSFNQEMERLNKENNLKEEQTSFKTILNKAASRKKLKPSSR